MTEPGTCWQDAATRQQYVLQDLMQLERGFCNIHKECATMSTKSQQELIFYIYLSHI